MEILSQKHPIKGELLTFAQLAGRGGVSLSTVKRIVSNGRAEVHKKGGVNYVYYREFLRASWIHGTTQGVPGPKGPRKSN